MRELTQSSASQKTIVSMLGVQPADFPLHPGTHLCIPHLYAHVCTCTQACVLKSLQICPQKCSIIRGPLG